MDNIVLEPFPFQMELVLEAFLVENPIVLSLDDEAQPEIIDYEFPLSKGRKKTNGRIDIVAVYPNDVLAIIEIKNHVIDDDAYTQLSEYFEKKEQLLNELIKKAKIDGSKKKNYKWIGILVGTHSIAPSVDKKIQSEKINGQMPCMALVLNRYKSRNSNQVFITTDKFGRITDKDYSKYKFNGRRYGKGPLVFAVVNEYVQNHQSSDYKEIRAKFVKLRNDAIEKSENVSFLKKERYYFREKIYLSDGTCICVSNQWGKNFNEKILPELQKLFPNICLDA